MTRPAENQQTVEAALTHYFTHDVDARGVTSKRHRDDCPGCAARAALRDLVAQAADAAELRKALEVLLDWAEKTKGGYEFADPSEEWYATRDYARSVLARLEQGEALRDGRTEGASVDGAR